MDRAHNASVVMGAAPTVALSVTAAGNGTVTSSPGGIACSGGTCSGTFPVNSVVSSTKHSPLSHGSRA